MIRPVYLFVLLASGMSFMAGYSSAAAQGNLIQQGSYAGKIVKDKPGRCTGRNCNTNPLGLWLSWGTTPSPQPPRYPRGYSSSDYYYYPGRNGGGGLLWPKAAGPLRPPNMYGY